MKELYTQQREVEKQLTVGAKVLSFKSGPVTFKDSLCFLPMPLSAFTATFNLRELKKGYFPHEFNTPDHQEYVGPIPALQYYDPDGLPTKKKEALQTWQRSKSETNWYLILRKSWKSTVTQTWPSCRGDVKPFARNLKPMQDSTHLLIV